MGVTVHRLLRWALECESEWLSGIAANAIARLYLRGRELSDEGWELYLYLDAFAPVWVRIRLADEMCHLDLEQNSTIAELRAYQAKLDYIINAMQAISAASGPPGPRQRTRLAGPDGEEVFVSHRDAPRRSVFFPPLCI